MKDSSVPIPVIFYFDTNKNIPFVYLENKKVKLTKFEKMPIYPENLSEYNLLEFYGQKEFIISDNFIS